VLVTVTALPRVDARLMNRNGCFQLDSPVFADGALMPPLHSGEGLNLSPPLHWSGVPLGTCSFALLLEDPDAPAGSWVHWLLFNIPAELRSLPAGLERRPQLANGARHGSCWGVGRLERIGYQGPLPPPGTAHRYVFELHALDVELDLPPGCSVFELREAMQGHQLGCAALTGLYGRTSQAASPARP
jgi:Raf kinase inhibitor-like YbhB/YbcL family protein